MTMEKKNNNFIIMENKNNNNNGEKQEKPTMKISTITRAVNNGKFIFVKRLKLATVQLNKSNRN